MALQQDHGFTLSMIVKGAHADSLSLVSARTTEGKQRVVLCFLMSSRDQDAYIPLAVLSDSESGELVRGLVWPALGCPVFLEAQEGEVDLLD
jgi:hypothetical protein